MKQVIDKILTGVDVISETQVSFAGLRGWQYVYRFQDPAVGTGVHVHVFLFQGNRLYTLVFQALPPDRLQSLAKTFDQILARYRVFAPAPSTPAPTASPSASP